MPSKSLFDTAGGRRFIITLGCGIVTSLLVYLTSITPEVYGNVIIWTVGQFIVGNTVEQFKGMALPGAVKNETKVE